MTALIAWGQGTLVASAALVLLVLIVRSSVWRWVGPQLGYMLWALPAVRLVMPALPASWFGDLAPTAGGMQILFAGPTGPVAAVPGASTSLGSVLFALWVVGAVTVVAVHAVQHLSYCRGLAARCTLLDCIDGVRVIATDVDGPLAFGVVWRVIAVPRDFLSAYDATERDLALAHELAHHVRGDLIANWASIVVLAVHWWNPLAWVAIRAFRDDQELATDARVVAARGPAVLPAYARVLAKASGIGALPACNLNARSNLKGRLMMLGQQQRSGWRLVIGRAALALIGGAALAATATAGVASDRQAVSIVVKPDGQGGYGLIAGNAAAAPAARLPRGTTLPADFDPAGGCDLSPAAKPGAMAIKGTGATRTYTVMCASAAKAPLRMTLAEGLASLTKMRASVTSQPASASFPEAERIHALGAIDRSIAEVEASIASAR